MRRLLSLCEPGSPVNSDGLIARTKEREREREREGMEMEGLRIKTKPHLSATATIPFRFPTRKKNEPKNNNDPRKLRSLQFFEGSHGLKRKAQLRLFLHFLQEYSRWEMKITFFWSLTQGAVNCFSRGQRSVLIRSNPFTKIIIKC